MDETIKDLESNDENFNYFAMSLKKFFILMSTSFPEMLEFMCHNFVQQWVNKGEAKHGNDDKPYQQKAKRFLPAKKNRKSIDEYASKG